MRQGIGPAAILVAAAMAVTGGSAQEIEPRAYANAPVGVNFLIVGATYSSGALIFDEAVPITDARLKTPATVLAYARSFGLWGQNAKVDVIVPYTWLSGDAKFQGDPVSREVDGFADPRVRLSINFHGAPALSLEEFRAYKQDLIVAASVQVVFPVGQYDPSRLVNIGSNRWAGKLETGVSKALGKWSLESALAATFYGDNDEFYQGTTREQETLFALQGHAIRSFGKGSWLALDVTYYTGGRTTIGGVKGDDLQRTWRGGGTLALPVNRRNSVKLYASTGVSARTGNNYDLFGVGWQYRWGGGL